MDLAIKLKYAKQSVDTIAQHDDEDGAVRHAVLDALQAHIQAEKTAMDARIQARVTALAVNDPPSA